MASFYFSYLSSITFRWNPSFQHTWQLDCCVHLLFCIRSFHSSCVSLQQRYIFSHLLLYKIGSTLARYILSWTNLFPLIVILMHPIPSTDPHAAGYCSWIASLSPPNLRAFPSGMPYWRIRYSVQCLGEPNTMSRNDQLLQTNTAWVDKVYQR